MLANRAHLFAFVSNRAVPYTNNVSERPLRPSVIFRKVTNGFRCMWGAETYASFRSVVSTAKSQGFRSSLGHAPTHRLARQFIMAVSHPDCRATVRIISPCDREADQVSQLYDAHN
jgi:hypothetical protein